MPRLSVWMIRSALVALVAGSILGAVRLGDLPSAGEHAEPLRAAHADLMLFGWLVQFVLGVGYWILPRYAQAPDRGPAWAAWAAVIAFQIGLAAAVTGATFMQAKATIAARLLFATSTLVLVVLLYPRAKAFANPSAGD